MINLEVNFMRRLTAMAAVPLTALLFTGMVAAQEPATPEADGPRGQISPESCVVAPAAAADVVTMLTTGESAAFQMQIPLGAPATLEDQTLVTDSVRQILACLNAGDFAREASLTTANGAKLLMGGLAVDGPDALAATLAEPPTARRENRLLKLLAVTDVSELADGRLGAFVVLNEPTRLPEGPETLLFVFAREGDTLKLDQLLGFSIIAPAADATPAAQ